jgi:hypothetical protein
MSATIFQAACELQRRIVAPAGAVNTIAQTLVSPQHIRVLVDPMYWQSIGEVPQEFEGYPVAVEQRPAMKSQWQG